MMALSIMALPMMALSARAQLMVAQPMVAQPIVALPWARPLLKAKATINFLDAGFATFALTEYTLNAFVSSPSQTKA